MRKFFLLLSVSVLYFSPGNIYCQGEIKTVSLFSKSLQKVMYCNVYYPPGFKENPDQKYPVIYFLHGWGSSNTGGDRIMRYADSLIVHNLIEPVLIVCANNKVAPFGGSHYMNSILWGDYESFMVEDLVKWVENSGRVLTGRANRFLMGQSMGGYGSFRYAVYHKEIYSAIAAHGSPMDYTLIVEKIKEKIIKEAGSTAPYHFKYSNGKFTKYVFANAGAYSPNPESTQDYISPKIVDFPFDENGEVIERVFEKFLENDPILFIEKLKPDNAVGILFGCGKRDELGLYSGNIALTKKMTTLGLAYEFYDHNGMHGMPNGFIDRALKYFDSLSGNFSED